MQTKKTVVLFMDIWSSKGVISIFITVAKHIGCFFSLQNIMYEIVSVCVSVQRENCTFWYVV